MYDHIVRGLKDLAQEARNNRFKRLSSRDIELLETAAIKFRTLQASLNDSRTAIDLLQTQVDRMKELMNRNLIAWQNEEDSVREEHAELIADLEQADG